ncbi:transcriptional regulator, ArsR family [Methanocaldococcus vulcanius M7]|uniref:Transcriptional regulator, ArsR family n=1 Tax=Methanocaldococcus vulcanius (strain ATCC 700851 / DSM 12094 / M7) TaxID=579137 RepID=C9REY5_METVM|nr:helix-turn-helix domain-containing protein [Methanocaldococcus vulcanius]ACX72137.1 transcriptional regulator, ArsR family [Methanocaldococcus vulcanius M7]
MSEEIERSLKMFKALSHPTRLKILAMCLDKELSSKEIRRSLNISKPLLISHIKKLVDAELLECRIEFDRERSILRKYYKTKEDLMIDLPNLLYKIKKQLN